MVCEVIEVMIRTVAFSFFLKTLLHISKYLTSDFKLQMFLCHVEGDAQLFLPTNLKPSQISHCAELCELLLKRASSLGIAWACEKEE